MEKEGERESSESTVVESEGGDSGLGEDRDEKAPGLVETGTENGDREDVKGPSLESGDGEENGEAKARPRRR